MAQVPMLKSKENRKLFLCRQCLNISICFIMAGTVQGQTVKASCDCPQTHYAGIKADTAFHVSGGKTIVLCGYRNPESKPATFSEFILAVCGQDTIIDFWGAEITCRLRTKKDTLLIDQLENLPAGKGFSYQETVWTTEKMYFSNEKLVRNLAVNRHIRKYSPQEIQAVLRSFETAKPGLDDSKMVLANKLFMSAISGSLTARKYFNGFAAKFGEPDGAFAEEYSDLKAMLELWDRGE